ncbi:MAG: DUF559 domain-containing protein [Phycisphaerae bacterium]|nr:DUF559 domain-containing protein [Phycisphaerae bacterium]
MTTDPSTLANARELRADQTEAEAILWRCLRGNRLAGLKFHRQHPVEQYIADFLCRPAMLIVELDGISHEGRVEYDAKRQEHLELLGFEVLRFKNRDLRAMEGVLAVIERRAKERIAAGVRARRY